MFKSDVFDEVDLLLHHTPIQSSVPSTYSAILSVYKVAHSEFASSFSSPAEEEEEAKDTIRLVEMDRKRQSVERRILELAFRPDYQKMKQ